MRNRILLELDRSRAEQVFTHWSNY